MFLIPLIIKMGIPQQFAKATLIASFVVLAIASLGIAKCSYDRSIIKAHDAALRASNERLQATNQAATANEAATVITDTSNIAAIQKEQTNAINNATDSAPNAATIAANCVILRQHGIDTSHLPQCH
jgi:predicted PurR-regulated permease PerM